MPGIKLIAKKGSTLHDYPYSSPTRKCPHFWIINVTPPGPNHCLHRCLYCYARCAIYSDYSEETHIYNNLPELVKKDLERISLCPPISISNVSDPCQPIPQLRDEVKRLVKLLMDYGVSFAITTKGNPGFLLDLPGFINYEPMFIAITVEGNAAILSLLSPLAPAFKNRLETVSQLSSLGINTIIRLDPIFIHLFQALYGSSWFREVEGLICTLETTGAKHIVCSTGRLLKSASRPGGQGSSLWERVRKVIRQQSPVAARSFEREYIYEKGGTSQGYVFRKDLRLRFHQRMKELVESRGMTYATCQELGAGESDSRGLAHCQRFVLPFARKQPDGSFKPVKGCTANCHVSCQGLPYPACGEPLLISPGPFKIGCLK